MVEVRYKRGSAWLWVMFGLVFIMVGSVHLFSLNIEEMLGGCIFLLIGALIIHVASLRLRERDVLLRLTPEQVWTKEFGWQPWSKMIIALERDGNGYTLEIHRPSDFTPRFYARVSTLTITAKELKAWTAQFATRIE